VRFEVPLDARFVGLVRGVAATIVAAVPEVDEERIDDVRVAVSEACTLVGAGEARGSAGAALVMTCALDDGWLRLEVSSTAGIPAPGGDPRPTWGVQLLDALVDEVTIRGKGPPTVCLGLRTTAPRRDGPPP
jgi:hypothetical protein